MDLFFVETLKTFTVTCRVSMRVKALTSYEGSQEFKSSRGGGILPLFQKQSFYVKTYKQYETITFQRKRALQNALSCFPICTHVEPHPCDLYTCCKSPRHFAGTGNKLQVRKKVRPSPRFLTQQNVILFTMKNWACKKKKNKTPGKRIQASASFV